MALINGNGEKKSVMEMLKVALGVVLLGGGAAFSGGQYAASEVAAEIKVFSQNIIAMETRLQKAESSAGRAETSAARTEAMLELLLKKSGIRPPPRDDAGETDIP